MKKIVWMAVIVVVLGGLGAYEWRYSAEMQAHIDDVDRDLSRATMRSTYSTGLLSSLENMRAETEVAGEIFETHEYVHTLKDEMLARRIKAAASDGVTVGGAIHNVLAVWPSSVAHPEGD